MRPGHRILFVWCILILVIVLPGYASPSIASSLRQADPARQKAQAMLSKMTPEEKVGQLFLVTFTGTMIDETSQIYELISRHHVGGVVLLRSNDNFGWQGDLLSQTYQLTGLLQQTKWDATQKLVMNPSGVSYSPQYIPLWVGMSQEGNSFPYDQILGELTALPSLMSIGATWNPDLAEQVGAVMGKELAGLGINLYLGPSLDVLENVPATDDGDDLGSRSFGGNPYWVGKMGQSYISGLHQGSGNRLVVIAKHFPGRGGSDRPPEDEIPTVRRSLEQLLQNELLPFFAVAGQSTVPEKTADGLLVTHIRYEGFQGTIRATTRPVSSDATALELILNQAPLADWRANGGILVSDNLGSQAIKQYYDPAGGAFDARTAAREAFLAGNDLLFVDHFIASNDPDSFTTILRTLDFFAQKYREDEAFAQRVDASVERVLTKKFSLYPSFNLENVIGSANSLAELGVSQQVTFDVARRSATLISPSINELPNILPRPPELRDRIVFLTDVQSGRQCSGCQEQVSLPVDGLQSAVLRLYGPRAGGLVSQNLMSSYSFSDLTQYLNGNITDLEQLKTDLQMANWVVVSMIKPSTTQPDSMAFKRLLSERFDLIQNKKVIVFAFGAPYYLDATDISKLTAYYGMYSQTPEFVEVAARLLFNEQVASGSLPVSVPGVGYDLSIATSPDPTQVIPLSIDLPDTVGRPTSTTQQPTPEPIYKVGDIIQLQTGVIFDYNRRSVPDGTSVRFVFNIISQESPTQQQVDTQTIDGIARAIYRIERSGVLEVHAATNEGARTNLLRLDMVSGGVTVIPPTPFPTETPTATPTMTVTPTATVTSTPIPPVNMQVTDWLYVIAILVAGAIGVAWLGIRWAIARWGLRWALCGVIGGMLSYNYLAFKLPGTERVLREAGTPGVLLITAAGVLVGWGIGLLWKQISPPVVSGERARQRRERTAQEDAQGVQDREQNKKDRPATGPK